MSSIKFSGCSWAVGLAVLFAWCGSAHAANSAGDADVQKYANEQANVKTVQAFAAAFANLDFDACRRYVGDYLVQHDPQMEEGLDGLKKTINGKRAVRMHNPVEIKLVVADGDYVLLFSHSINYLEGTPPHEISRGQAVAEIFRLENGKIVEHWNTTEDIPEKPTNSGLF